LICAGPAGIDDPVLNVGSLHYDYGQLSTKYLVSPPKLVPDGPRQPVCRRGGEVLLRPGGFLLWQTKERVGTPRLDPRYIAFVDGKSTRARTGLLVHMTAPTIHAGWDGNITLEIANLGPFTFGLRENDVIAQITVAMISSSPSKTHADAKSSTIGQEHVEGSGTA
jgi:deoxycytidine triphosphate deaminase